MGVLNEIAKLQTAGCVNVKGYSLCSNYGYTFSKDGVDYDLRYWENCYGVYGGGWRVDPNGKGFRGSPSFGDDFDGVVQWIKDNL
jgi:hypothetical protein